MSSWTLAPCLEAFNDELEQVAPDRDHSSDGTIGDEEHQQRDSDHNPDDNGFVCASDRDKDLRAAFTMEDVVQYLIAECRKPNNVGLDRGRLNYIIYRRRIWRADTGWAEEEYDGENPHDEHCHLSCEHALTYVNDARPWGLLERFGDDMDQETFNARMDAYCQKWATDKNGWESSPLGRLVWDHQHLPNPLNDDGGKAPAYDVVRDTAQAARDTREALAELNDKVDNLAGAVINPPPA